MFTEKTAEGLHTGFESITFIMRVSKSLLALALAGLAESATPDLALIKKLGHEKLGDLLEAHAVLGSLAWVVILPIGAILFALLRIPRLFWIHSAIQTIGLCCLIISFVLGVIIGKAYGKLYVNPHTIIGTILFIIALLQPVWGILQHRVTLRTGKKSFWAYLHRWVGRFALTLAMINGGLGFILTKGFSSYSAGRLKAYISVSVIMWLIYVSAILYDTFRKSDVKGRSERNSSTDPTSPDWLNNPTDWKHMGA